MSTIAMVASKFVRENKGVNMSFFHERKSGKQHASTHGCGFHN